MAEQNKKIEDLIREAYYLKFYPWLLTERGVDYDASDYEDVAEMIKDARNLDEARNIIINAAQQNPAMMGTFVRSYVDKNRKDGEDWNENAFDFSTLKMRPIDIENVILDKNESEENLYAKANRLANALGYDINNGGLNSLISDYLGDEKDIKYGKKWFQKGIENDIRKKKTNTDDYLNFLMANDYSPTVDEANLADDLSSILARVNEIKYMQDRSGFEKFADQLTHPNVSEREAKGQTPNAADKVTDLASLFGVGKIGKSGLSTKAKLGAGTGLGALMDYGHGIADSLLTERTYIDTPDQQLKKRGDVVGALTNYEAPLTSAATGALALMGGGIGFRGGKKVIDSVMNSNAAKTAKKKVTNAIDRLMGNGNTEKALDKERRALQKEHGEFLVHGEKSGITPEDDAMNVRRLLEIEEELDGTKAADEAIKKIAETGATLLFTNPPQGMKRGTARAIPYILGDWKE